MTIELTPEQRRFVDEQLETGEYSDESEVLAHALNLWQRYQERTAEICARVQEGIDAADAGRGTLISTPEEAEAFKQKVIKRGRELRAERERKTR